MTGGTGVVGGAVVERLLATGNRVTLLIRASSADAARSRLELLLHFYGYSQALERLAFSVLGDTTLPRLGLSDSQYEQVCEGCSHVIHCAGLVRMNLPIDEARRSAVRATHNVIALARSIEQHTGRMPKMEFVSTVGVGGKLHAPIPEQWIDVARSFHNSYEQSKAEAEVVIRDAMTKGLQVTVHRPSMVVGHSSTGRISSFQVFYYLADFLSGRRTLGLYPDLSQAKLDIVGADRVADAIVWSSRQIDTAGRILHLCAGPEGSIALDQLRALVRSRFVAHGIDVPSGWCVSRKTFRTLATFATLLTRGKLRRALATLPIFLDYLSDEQAFENSQTVPLLNSAGLVLDRSSDIVGPVLDYYLHRTQQQRRGRP